MIIQYLSVPQKDDAEQGHQFDDNDSNQAEVAALVEQLHHVPAHLAHVLGVLVHAPIQFLCIIQQLVHLGLRPGCGVLG